ncbi:MAG: HAD family hydrolase [Thermoguttaceae bacterium]|jgi:D-glycero-D-manno-heptose 1,7-bisphosphate phosphatase
MASQNLEVFRGAMRAAVFLDRDGVLIENRPDYVKDWSEVEFFQSTFEAMRRLADSPMAVVIVTNQASVGRGLMEQATAWALHRRIVAEIERRGGRIDASYICPHRPEDGCLCRKPAPGLIHQAQRDLGLDLAASWLVGDSWTDLEAAAAAGVRGILVRTGRGAEQIQLATPEMLALWPNVADLTDAVGRILGAPCGQ